MPNSGQSTKHVPMRTCIATGQKRPKKELLRLVKLAEPKGGEDAIQVDVYGKLRGRGANIIPEMSALQKALQNGAIERALKLERKLTPGEVEELTAAFEKAVGEKEFRQGRKPVKLKVSRVEFEQKVQQA